VTASLAAGVGGALTIFALAYPLVRPALPYPAPERLLDVQRTAASGVSPLLLSTEFAQVRLRTQACSPLAAYRGRTAVIERDGIADRVDAVEVSAGFFEALGLRPVIGRTFVTADEGATPAVAMVSERFWKHRMSGRVDAVGTTITFDATPTTIVGIFSGAYPIASNSTDIWLPLPLTASGLLVTTAPGVQSHRASPLPVVCRLAADASIGHARTELERLDRHPGLSGGSRALFRLRPIADAFLGRGRLLLLLLEGAVLVLLALVGTNAACVILVRASAREAQFHIRGFRGATALGLARGRAIEALTIVLPGAALGYLLATWLVPIAAARAPDHLFSGAGPSLDAVSFVFLAFLLAATSAVTAGVPALYVWLTHRHRAVQAATGGAQRAMAPLRFLLAAEVALAIVLLAAAASLVVAFTRVSQVPLGFTPRDVVTARVIFADRQLVSLAARSDLAARFARDIGQLGGVSAVGFATEAPFSQESMRHEEMLVQTGATAELVTAASLIVSAGYFDVLGIGIMQGGQFDAADGLGGLPGAVVSETFARRYLREDPLAAVLIIDGLKWRVVGIANDVTTAAGVADPREAVVYRHIDDLRGYSAAIPAWRWITRLHFFARSEVDARALAAALQESLRSVDPTLALDDITSMTARVQDGAAVVRYATALVGALGLLSVVTAAIGIYALLMHFVVQRRKEIGIRLAIGAMRRNVIAFVAAEAGIAIGPGIVLGAAAGWMVPRLLGAALPDVHLAPPTAVLAAVVVIGCVAVTGALVPIARACRVDPVRTLKAE
jgi:putative ABC transport system permease protein